MTLKGLLKKKDKGEAEGSSTVPPPEFTFFRTTTHIQERIEPPTFPGDKGQNDASSKRFSRFRRHSKAGETSPLQSPTEQARVSTESRSESRSRHKLSEKLHLGRDRSSSTSSANIPSDLPDVETQSQGLNSEEKEAAWEKRATVLAGSHPTSRRRSRASVSSFEDGRSETHVSNSEGDQGIQEAIRLHEAGDLERSTAIFARLADPNGANNALSQVLYGLALRHGWGCHADPQLAVTYLSSAATNSAQVEELALAAGMNRGGAAKGELVLAIFELGNCFRNGWGVEKDLVAARQYFETAANLGDVDAMSEVANCYLNGLGTKKDKFKAAQYLRKAEEKGSKSVSESWIWKDKYGGPPKREPPKPKT